ncbi:uncharacterized protein LOC123259380 isoform X3 [Cotesia glomerata]|uniref:uncharacterized protein LOC123259380 isoform X3 n=1 Tax=Cotesia glomerata TaxID=32391 RepID=UPI001D035BFA|nr:uncharacterized protein LOC123259380 isoform X3 [Cotesia glomerata]
MDYRHGFRYKEDNDMENDKDCATNFYFTSDDSKVASKRGVPQTRGTAISFGFRRRSRGDGHHQPIKSYEEDLPPRSKSLGPEQVRRRLDEDDRHQRVQSASSGRSTPRLAPPKKEIVGNVRMNRFGFRQPQPGRYTDKVADCSSHSAGHFNQEKSLHQQQHQQQQHQERSRTSQPAPKLRPSPVNNPPAYNSVPSNLTETNRIPRVTSTNANNIPEPVSKYTLHTSHLPLPQYAVRVTDANSKIAKTVANQNRKVSTASKSSAGSQSGSGTEDSGIGSGCQPGYLIDHEMSMLDVNPGASSVRRIQVRPRNLRMVVNGKSFDVRDVDDDNTVTEISVIPLPKAFASVNLSTGLVRERTSQFHQRIANNKDNRYCTTESITSMSTTSSEGYDEGLGEEKVFKDRSRSEKVLSIKSDFSPPSSDDPEYGHGEAMADEYSFSSSDECRANQRLNSQRVNAVAATQVAGLNVQKNSLRSVMLTIEDPAFAAAAASSTTLIDDETSPVDSLVDSLTASITQSDGQASKREKVPDKVIGNVEDDSPGTPTNASNSLSLSEGREYFDDEIADQPGLTFDDTTRVPQENLSGRASRQVTDSSNTLMEPVNKTNSVQGKHIENSPLNCRRISRTGSVDTLSPCESITSDDLMLDYERSETSSFDEPHRRFESSPAIHEMDDATILSELEAQGEEVMREWSSLLGTHPQISNSNLTNNNLVPSNNTNINQQISESGIGSARTSRLLRSRTGTDSPRSLDSVRTRQVASPFRPVLTANGQSPSLDSGDEGSPRLERCNYQQDIVYIKTGLLKLMRIIQESEEKDLTRADTLNPFNTSVNGLFHNLNEDSTDSSGLLSNGALNIADELTDLRRQVIFLQGQLEDKDRAIQNLQLQVAKQQDLINSVDSQNSSVSYGSSTKDMSNAATQTEKIRPISAGPSLLQGFPQDNGMGPLVSWSESWNQNISQRPLSIAEMSSNGTSSSSTKNNRKIERPRTIRPRQEQTRASNLLLNGNSSITNSINLNNNGVAELEKEKSQIQPNSVVRRIIKPRDSASQIIDDEFTKDKSEAPKSCIPALKKPTPRVTRQTNISINRAHNA